VAREGVLNFHFCIYGLDGAYAGGFYHGLLQLSEEYPFAPPKLLFFTPSGRFEVNKPICTSFTNYHKETWASTWNVRTMVLATISFMNSEEPGAGYLGNSYLSRKQYARESMEFNNKNPLFRQLFKKQVEDYQRKKSA
jgi:ubiquitin-conjugating enzyme E2 J2